uniref:DUF4806 domain-containing protein n=1 Tax=Anopheles atroparvus TaxID=41427 RepID=A0AAG5DIY5_ANOAO
MSSQRSFFVKTSNGKVVPLQPSKSCILYRLPKSSLPDALKAKLPLKIVTHSVQNAQVMNNDDGRSLSAAGNTPADTPVIDVELLNEFLPAKKDPQNEVSCTLSADEIIPSTNTAIQQIEFINIPEQNPLALDAPAVEPDDNAPLTISKKMLREVVNEVMTEQLKAVHKKLDKISQRLTKIEEAATKMFDHDEPYGSQDTLQRINVDISKFKWTPVDSLDALIELNNKLNDEADSSYAEDLARWMYRHIYVQNARRRLTKMMGIMFTPEFLTHLSWTGRGKTPKIAISKYNGVVEFFKKNGSTSLYKVDDREIADFFVLKLRYASLNLQRLKTK